MNAIMNPKSVFIKDGSFMIRWDLLFKKDATTVCLYNTALSYCKRLGVPDS